MSDALTFREGNLADELRPLYLNYLRKHPPKVGPWHGGYRASPTRSVSEKQRARHTPGGMPRSADDRGPS